MKTKSLLLALATVTMLCSCAQKVPQLKKNNIRKVVAAMTLEEKALLAVGAGMNSSAGQANSESGNGLLGLTDNIVPGCTGTLHGIERLGITPTVVSDGPAGLRISPTREGDDNTYYCTHFPIATLLASTWNTELVEEVGKAIGNEVLEYGVDVHLAPALNIHRHPLCGRNFEYYSEDPLVAGRVAAAYVRGVQSNGVGSSVKHFAVNNQETNRKNTDARVSRRAIREIYLKGFEIVVKEAKPWTVMSSYNLLNGTYTSESEELLTEVLRDEWGFEGMVMTDWGGGDDVAAQMQAGNDLLMPGTQEQMDGIIAAVRSGELDEAVLDRNVTRILEMVVHTPRFNGYSFSNKPDLEAHAAVTRQSATEGMVLLKNDGAALPLSPEIKKVALLGSTSYDFSAGGTGSGNVNHAYVVSLTEGLENAGYVLDQGLKAAYEAHISEEKAKNAPAPDDILGQVIAAMLAQPLPGQIKLSDARLSSLARDNDIALITLGRSSGEFADRVSSDFALSADERNLIERTCSAFHAVGKKVVVVLNIGGVIETASWKDLPDAILLAWQAGQEGGNSVTDVLRGAVSPSGKLPMTFPIDLAGIASSANFPSEVGADVSLMMGAKGSGDRQNIDYTNYEEDIYVGYRYFDSFGVDVSYPFGYGLSYTSFEYENPAVSFDGDAFEVSVDVKNVGSVAGKEAVQLYVAAPDSKTLNKPEKELKAFAKTAELAPGESQTLVLCVKVSDLASFDEAASAWVTDEGSYSFLLAASSRDIRASLSADVPAWSLQVSDILAPQAPVARLVR